MVVAGRTLGGRSRGKPVRAVRDGVGAGIRRGKRRGRESGDDEGRERERREEAPPGRLRCDRRVRRGGCGSGGGRSGGPAQDERERAGQEEVEERGGRHRLDVSVDVEAME